MSEYEQVPGAGNVNARFAFRVMFSGADQSDIPQLQAWNDHNLNTVTQESLTGTPGNGSQSMVAAVSTHAALPGVDWAVESEQEAGGAAKNRLSGSQSFVLLGTDAPASPFPKARTFNVALVIPSDVSAGSVGMQPVLAVKTFYAGQPPTVEFEYNTGDDASPVWKPMVSAPEGQSMAHAVGTTIHFTGTGSVAGTGTNNGNLTPVVRPGSGQKAADQTWIRSL